MENPVSCVLVSYNQEKFILDAIHSIFSQSYKNFELIIVDDCSTDSTFDKIYEYISNLSLINRKKIKSIVKNACNIGVTANFDKAFSFCSHDIVVVFAGDDISLPERLSTIVQHFTRYLGCAAYCSRYIPIDKNNHHIYNYPSKKYELFGFISLKRYLVDKLLFNRYSFNGCSAAYRKSSLCTTTNRGINAEDAILIFYALLKGNVFLDRNTLIQYRIINNSQSHLNGYIPTIQLIDAWSSLLLEYKFTSKAFNWFIIGFIFKENLKQVFKSLHKLLAQK